MDLYVDSFWWCTVFVPDTQNKFAPTLKFGLQSSENLKYVCMYIYIYIYYIVYLYILKVSVELRYFIRRWMVLEFLDN